jgi:hypothetical protein
VGERRNTVTKFAGLAAAVVVSLGILPLAGATGHQRKLLGIAEILTSTNPDRGTFVAVGGMNDKGTFTDKAAFGGAAPSSGNLTINVTSTLKGKRGTVTIKEKVSFKAISGISTGISTFTFTITGKSGKWAKLRGSGTGRAVTYPPQHRLYVLQGSVN